MSNETKSCENCGVEKPCGYTHNSFNFCCQWTPGKDQTPLKTDRELEQQVKDLKERLAVAREIIKKSMAYRLNVCNNKSCNYLQAEKWLADSKEVEK